jgi:hypothetical protein
MGSGTGCLIAAGPVSSPDRQETGAVERVEALLIAFMPRVSTSAGRRHSGLPQGEGPPHVVSEREPQQDGAHLLLTADQQPGEPHAAGGGIGAFGCTAFVVHQVPQAPSGGANPSPPARPWRARHKDRCDACCGLPGTHSLTPAAAAHSMSSFLVKPLSTR